MTLEEIVNLAEQEYGNRYQFDETTLILYANTIQQLAFKKDLNAFIYWGAYLTIDTDSGPYSFPTTVPVRKMIGVTRRTDAERFGTATVYVDDLDDYGMETDRYNERRFYEPGAIDHIGRTFTFSFSPDTAANTYRWVYYRRPQTISNIGQDSRVIIPVEYHHTVLYNGIIALADAALYGEKPAVPDEILRPILSDFWRDMEDQGANFGSDNHFSQGVV